MRTIVKSVCLLLHSKKHSHPHHEDPPDLRPGSDPRQHLPPVQAAAPVRSPRPESGPGVPARAERGVRAAAPHQVRDRRQEAVPGIEMFRDSIIHINRMNRSIPLIHLRFNLYSRMKHPLLSIFFWFSTLWIGFSLSFQFIHH